MKPDLDRPRNLALVYGVAGALALAAGAAFDMTQFYRSYLLGWVFWSSVALGCLPLLFLQHMTGGAWGLSIRRLLEAASATLPVVALGFVPIVLGLDHLYVWSLPDVVRGDEVLEHKALYLNDGFFAARTAFYFLVWIVMAVALRRWSLRQDRTADPADARRMQVFSGPAMLLFGITVTFASVDWVMSLEPHWFSTLFGLWFLVGQGLAGFAFVVAVLIRLVDREPFAGVVQPGVFHDLGKLLLAFVMVWAYLSFSQFLIVFSGNLPEEIPYYLARSQGGWQWVAAAIVLGHFVLPFTMLLSRDLKRSAGLLAGVATFVLVMRFVDLAWAIIPSYRAGELGLSWMDVAAPVAIGGLWLAIFFERLKAQPLLPLHDPWAAEAFENAEGH